MGIDVRVDRVSEIVRSIAPLLAGEPPEIQGAVLAELTAVWVWGHQVEGESTSSETTKKYRQQMLDAHVTLVSRLIPIHDGMLEAETG